MFSRVERSACATPLAWCRVPSRIASRRSTASEPSWTSAALAGGSDEPPAGEPVPTPVLRSTVVSTSAAFDRDAARSKNDENPAVEPLPRGPGVFFTFSRRTASRGYPRRGREPSFPLPESCSRSALLDALCFCLRKPTCACTTHTVSHSISLDLPRPGSVETRDRAAWNSGNCLQRLVAGRRPHGILVLSPTCGARSRGAGGHSLSLPS